MNARQSMVLRDDALTLALARVALAIGELAAALGVPPGCQSNEPFAGDGRLAGAPLPTAVMPVLAELVRLVQPDGVGERLTPREHEVLELLVRGLTDREIAARLCISPSTAETHVKRVRAKLGGGSRASVVARVVHGYAGPTPICRYDAACPRQPAI